MKKFAKVRTLALVSLASIALVASIAFAQTAVKTQDNQNAPAEWRGRGKRDGHRGFMRGAMFEKLNLTDDQKARMKQIHESFRERTTSLHEQLRAKRQELRQTSEGGTFNEALATQKLTEEAGLRAKLMGERFKLHQEMLAVLTSEQKAQLDQLRAEFKTKRAEFKAKRGEWRGRQRNQ
jgi:Spy/CpxP family protein refolding chaperone